MTIEIKATDQYSSVLLLFIMPSKLAVTLLLPTVKLNIVSKMFNLCNLLVFVIIQSYPAVMVGCSMNDDRVPYWLPLKWVARLRDQLSGLKQSDKPLVVCNVDYYGGHFGSEKTYRRFEQVQ